MKEYTVKVNKYKTEWYFNNKLHRENGPAVELTSGDKYWYINGKQHRENGPAIEYKDGSKVWYKNGKCHREDGPAVELINGIAYWWLNGVQYTKPEFFRLTQEKSVINDLEELAKKHGYKLVKT